MIGELADNPILTRLVEHSRWPSLRVTARLASGLALISLSISLYSYLLGRGRWTAINSLLLGMAWAATLLSPMVVTATALTLTSREARSQKGQLIRLTALPERTMAQGYIFSTLFRLRLLLMADVGLWPILIIGMLQLHIRYRFATVCYPGSSCGIEAVMRPPHVSGPLIVFTGVAIGVFGLNLLGAALGVWLGLWVGRAAEIITGVLVLVCLLGTALTGMMLYQDATALPYDDPWTILAFVLPIWIPYALSPVIMRLAARQMRGLSSIG
jgi:hypothetical protein